MYYIYWEIKGEFTIHKEGDEGYNQFEFQKNIYCVYIGDFCNLYNDF